MAQRILKQRLDKLIVERGLVESREKAHALILAGQVLANDQKIDKCGTVVPVDAVIRILGDTLKYVGRGGLKLEAALAHFSVDVQGKTALDVGASTGGFTDCLLQAGARHVYAVDVGYGQLAWKIRQDSRVTAIERVNIRTLDAALLPEPIDLAVIDVSFISLEKVLPTVLQYLKPEAAVVALIKPQFEVGRELVGKGGIVRDAEARKDAVRKIEQMVGALEMESAGVIPSPITGQDGNEEFLIYAVRRPANSSPSTTIDSISR